MGRHASDPPPSPPRRGRDLLVWGLFSALATVALVWLSGGGWAAAVPLGILVMVVFTVAWLTTAREPAHAPRAGRDPSGAGPDHLD